MKGDLIDKIASSIRGILPRLYNADLVFLSRKVETDDFGAKIISFEEARTLPGVFIAKGEAGISAGFTAHIIADKEWDGAEFLAFFLSPELPKLRDKLRVEGTGELSITNMQQFEDVCIIGLSEEQ